MMNAEYALAQELNRNANPSQGQARGERAALDSHDIDIDIETSVASTQVFATPTQESHPAFPSHAPSDGFPEAQHQPSSIVAPAAIPSSISAQNLHIPNSATDRDALSGLAPSTISQWVPDKALSAASDHQMRTVGNVQVALDGGRSTKSERALTMDLDEANPSTVPKIASSSTTDIPPAVTEADSATSAENIPKKALVAKISTNPETVTASVPSTVSTNVPQSATQITASSDHVTASSADPEKVTASRGSAQGGKGSPTSSNLEKEDDLEAGHTNDNLDEKGLETTKTEINPNIVDWDGPDDVKNPMNWSEKLKWANVAVIASVTFLTPLASSMLAPAVPEVMTEFKSTNQELASFVVSVYILGYATGPLVIAPMSELYGRVPIYHVCNVLFIVFTIACAVSSNLNMLIGWRFLQGTFGSCPLTIGGGTISDMIIQEKRGGVMSIWALGPLMGPVIGPVAGGYLAQAKGWRWIFWVIAMAAGVITISAFFSLRESYPPVLLERKAKRLREETGNESLTSKMKSPLSPSALFKLSIVRPMKLLVLSPIVLALSTYMAVVYGYLYLLFTTITEVYEGQYQFSQGTVGLTYLGIGVGSLFGVVIFGIASDKILKAKSKAGEMKAEYRLPPMIPGSFIIPIGLFLYGWSADKHVFWFVPIFGTALVGFGLLATFMPITTYLVDAFTIYSASALAANTVLRSLVGALLPLAGQKMYATLGLGWGNSLLGFIALAMCPIPVIFYRYGERIRKSPRFQVKL